jgi:ABC-2 type transport system ATP-binding protein
VKTLLTQQERLLWKLDPQPAGIDVLEQVTDFVQVQGEYVTTFYEESEVGEWNKQLIQAGVTVKEMNRKLPTLEDLFIEMTGGESID